VSEIASRYPTRFLRSYVRLKIATDPVYDAVFNCVRDSTEPLLDLGCGVGILALYLRERGFVAPIFGIDHDERKVAIAKSVVQSDADVSFCVADARQPFAVPTNVVLLDVLHYFRDEEQWMILRNASKADQVMVRDGIRDGSARYRITYACETLARLDGWLKAERLNFPTRQMIEQPFDGGFYEHSRPMSGRLPLNNYFFIFKRSSEGMTNE
jgi:SAM-dependent methyltransferase